MIRIRRVKPSDDNWEIEGCPREVCDELDRRGFIPRAGIVSRPGNQWIAADKVVEVEKYLRAMGIQFTSDFKTT